MWSGPSVLITSILFWSYVATMFTGRLRCWLSQPTSYTSPAEYCTTPLGGRSNCVLINDCPALATAFKQKPIPNSVVDFLRKSQCGSEGSTPKVCCGPLPQEELGPKYYIQVTPEIPSGDSDDIFAEDSLPAPKNQCGIDINENSIDDHSKLNEIPSVTPKGDAKLIEDRIYKGSPTKLLEFPWMALLGYRNNSGVRSFQCGGSLINHRYILTAAHCLIGDIINKYGSLESVRLGEYDIRHNIDCLGNTCADPPQEIPKDSIYPHPRYIASERSKRHDIGIVRLANRATYNNYVQPICLAEMNAQNHVGDQMFIAGWGKTLNGRRSNIKLKLQLPMVNKNSCAKKYRYWLKSVELNEHQLCAGGIFKEDACTGDSGGPLMKKSPEGFWEEFGVISTGHDCGRDGWPGLYTSVVGYLDWIKSTIRSSNL